MQAVRLGEISRVLVLNRNHIGDCLLTTPLLRSIKRRFPSAHVAVSVPESNQDLLVTNPHVDEIVIRPRLNNWGAKFGFAFQVRERGYDLVISLQEKSLFYAWATAYAALGRDKPITAALDHPRTRAFYEYNVRPIRSEQHEVYKYLDIAAILGCPRERSPVLELQPTPAARERVDRFLTSRGIDGDARFIGINPGGTKPDKRWPVERFAEVADRLYEELGIPTMVFGGPSDHEMAMEIDRRMTSHRPLVVAGRASLGDTAALMERCQFLVTGDTGPMHMAVALAVPVVALFGPTNPIKFGPFTRLKTILRHDKPCEHCHQPCLHTISAEECVSAALKIYTVPLLRRVWTDPPRPHR